MITWRNQKTKYGPDQSDRQFKWSIRFGQVRQSWAVPNRALGFLVVHIWFIQPTKSLERLLFPVFSPLFSLALHFGPLFAPFCSCVSRPVHFMTFFFGGGDHLKVFYLPYLPYLFSSCTLGSETGPRFGFGIGQPEGKPLLNFHLLNNIFFPVGFEGNLRLLDIFVFFSRARKRKWKLRKVCGYPSIAATKVLSVQLLTPYSKYPAVFSWYDLSTLY